MSQKATNSVDPDPDHIWCMCIQRIPDVSGVGATLIQSTHRMYKGDHQNKV